jgi:hypothetical protein
MRYNNMETNVHQKLSSTSTLTSKTVPELTESLGRVH